MTKQSWVNVLHYAYRLDVPLLQLFRRDFDMSAPTGGTVKFYQGMNWGTSYFRGNIGNASKEA